MRNILIIALTMLFVGCAVPQMGNFGKSEVKEEKIEKKEFVKKEEPKPLPTQKVYVELQTQTPTEYKYGFSDGFKSHIAKNFPQFVFVEKSDIKIILDHTVAVESKMFLGKTFKYTFSGSFNNDYDKKNVFNNFIKPNYIEKDFLRPGYRETFNIGEKSAKKLISNFKKNPELYSVIVNNSQRNHARQYQILLEKNDINEYEKFLKKYPNNKYENEIMEKIISIKHNEAHKDAISKDSIETYNSFLKDYPESEYFNEIEKRVKQLKYKKELLLQFNSIEKD